MKPDLIIANPPYGRIGSETTKYIIDNIDYNEYINLLPSKDYKILDLYKYVNVNYGKMVWQNLNDAKTLPDICNIGKEENNYKTFSDYEIENIFDKRLSKFWAEQLKRKPTYVEHVDTPRKDKLATYTGKNSFCVGVYTAVNLVNDLKKSIDYFKTHDINTYIEKDSWKAQGKIVNKRGDPYIGYIWNRMNPDYKIDEVFNLSGNVLSQIVTVFSIEEEKINFSNWWYSAELSGKPTRSGLASILISMMHKPGHYKLDMAIPRVDWHKAWSDEEILKDYGYNDKEIEEILKIGEITGKHSHNYGDDTFN